MSEDAKFKIDEKVRCVWGDHFYPATVKQFRQDLSNNQVEYFVHYERFNKKFDEWVEESSIVKLVEDNGALSPRANDETVSAPKSKSVFKDDMRVRLLRMRTIQSSVPKLSNVRRQTIAAAESQEEIKTNKEYYKTKMDLLESQLKLKGKYRQEMLELYSRKSVAREKIAKNMKRLRDLVAFSSD